MTWISLEPGVVVRDVPMPWITEQPRRVASERGRRVKRREFITLLGSAAALVASGRGHSSRYS
jgi:hypothetical protein